MTSWGLQSLRNAKNKQTKPLNQVLINCEVNDITSKYLKEKEKSTFVMSSVPWTWKVPSHCYGIEWWGFWALEFEVIRYVSTSVVGVSQNLHINITLIYLFYRDASLIWLPGCSFSKDNRMEGKGNPKKELKGKTGRDNQNIWII